MRWPALFSLLTALAIATTPVGAQFAVGGDARVDPDDFVVTTFAADLNYPVGMVELEDGSVLVAVANGGSFFSSSSGRILRLEDTNDDGVADVSTIIEEGLQIGGPTALYKVDDLLFVTGQGKPIAILKLGPAPDFEVTELGRVTINDSSDWLHPNSALVARRVGDTYELFFPLGSKVNFAKTTATRSLGSNFGLSADLAGDAIHRLRFTRDGDTLTGVDVIQIATGLRSASGLAFHPETGDLYFEDNGIDGLEQAIEAHSADEINVIPNADLGGDIEDFGFPDHYIEYRTGEFVGGGGIPPLVAFTPLPNPADGSESEGPNEIAFAPPGFPPGLNNGLFVGFHGQFSRGGLRNEENPLVYVDLDSGRYFHFVSNEEPAVGHLIGLLATGDRLFVSDISGHGGFGSSAARTGAIYQIRYIGTPTVVESLSGETPDAFGLDEAFPNPFNPTTTVRFRLREGAPSRTRLTVYDMAGQAVRRLVEKRLSGGHYQATWDGRDTTGQLVASGVYNLRLQAGAEVASRRVTFLK